MKKLWIILLSNLIVWIAWAISIWQVWNVQEWINKWYVLSDKYTSIEECSEKKNRYNMEYSSYTRSNCFEDWGKYVYFICGMNEICNAPMKQLSTMQQSSSMSTSGGNQILHKDKLDKFIEKVWSMKETMSADKFRKTLDGVVSKLDALEKRYSSNASIKGMIVYLNDWVKWLYNQSDIDDFFCQLTGGCNEVVVSNTITNNTNSSVNTSINNTNQSMNDINKKDECKKMQLFWNISICDTWKKWTYQDMNNLCPAWYHVPNYWEMDYIIKSWVVLDFTESSYYINSLYSDIVKVDSYPFAKYPFLLKRFNNQYTMNHTSDLTWLNNLSKENILCINNDANTPKSDTNWANWTSCGVNFDNLIWKYNLSRKYLIRDEKIIIESLSNQLLKWNIDYVVQLECSDKGLLKKESIKKVNSCNYWYKLQNNDCIVDPLICNLENFWNTHPTNWMICSWKNLWEEKKDYWFFRYWLLKLNKQSVWYSSELDIRLNWENNEMKKNMLKKYQTQYNNKVDIDINCQLSENKDWIRDHRDFNVFTSCKINGLFWQ